MASGRRVEGPEVMVRVTCTDPSVHHEDHGHTVNRFVIKRDVRSRAVPIHDETP